MRDPFFNHGLTIDEALAALEQASSADCDANLAADHVSLSCYDPEGNLTKGIDRNGRRTEYEYDFAGRPTEERWYSAAGELLQTATFRYDVLGNLLTATDPDSNYVYTYDELNRRLTEDNNPNESLDVPRLILTHEYDAEGNRIRTTDSSGVSVDSEYDVRNRLSSRRWSVADIDDASVEFAYDAASELAEVRRYADSEGNQLVSRTEHTRDLAGQETGITHFDALDQVLTDYDHQYNEFAELTHETHHEQSFDYLYDPAGQLIEAIQSSIGSESFEYDLNGNRVGSDIVNGVSNQLLSDGEFTYEYDGEGNLITKTDLTTGEVTHYSYDHDNRLVSAEVRDADGNLLTETEFIYDVFGRRIAHIAEGVTVFTVYSGDNAWADFDSDGNVIARYLTGDRIDHLLARQRGQEGTAWYLADRLDTVRDIVDASGTIIAQADYSAFGNIISTTDELALDRFTFTGREWFADLELFHYRARAYDAGIGQFISQDPLAFEAGDENLYRYVFNTPTNATDPTGEVTTFEYVVIAILGVELGIIVGAAGGTLAVTYGTLFYGLIKLSSELQKANEAIERQTDIIEDLCGQTGTCRVKR